MSRLLLALLLAAVGSPGAMSAEANDTPPDVEDFWPEVAGDLPSVSWAHAVNSRRELVDALEGDVMMLEADISLGSDGETPIMAHPPATDSDLTLLDFLAAVAGSTSRKGAKLDFKSTEALEHTPPVMEALGPLRFPLWVNADICAGPGGAARPAVSAERFLALSARAFPGRTLSVGWTTGALGDRYTAQHVRCMLDALAAANVSSTHPVTFPVRAAIAARSKDELLSLLHARPTATLTLWGAEEDEVDDAALLVLAKEAGFARVYVDLPKPVPGLSRSWDALGSESRSGAGGADAACLPAILAAFTCTAMLHL